MVMRSSSANEDTLATWLDAEGASLIGTLRKAYGNEAHLGLLQLIDQLVERAEELGAGHPAAAETRALGVAHLLPVVLRRALSLRL